MNPQTENHEVKFQDDMQALRKASAEAQANIMVPAPAKATLAAAVRVIEGQQQQIDMLLAHILGDKTAVIAPADNPEAGSYGGTSA